MRTTPRPRFEHSAAAQTEPAAPASPSLADSDRFVPVATLLAVLGMLVLIFMGRW